MTKDAMKTIYRYQIQVSDRVTVDMPLGAEILYVGAKDQHPDIIDMWALVDKSQPTITHYLRIFGTGYPFSEADDDLRHLGSVITAGGALVWHVFREVS